MRIVCLDLEGVLISEIWLHLADKTGIDELRQTTRDIKVYSDLMDMRLEMCRKYDLGIADIQQVVSQMQPLEGATDFISQLRKEHQVVILSDTFYEFALPLMPQLGNPVLLCHKLDIQQGAIVNYHLRQEDPKKKAVLAFQSLNYKVVAAGDSYNDLSMLETADRGVFFRAPDNIIEEVEKFEATDNYNELFSMLSSPL